jgi:Tfp pilus assembly protein PilF
MVSRWRLQSIERLLTSLLDQNPHQTTTDANRLSDNATKSDNPDEQELDWIEHYRRGDIKGALLDIEHRLPQAKSRLERARLHNDFGYITLANNEPEAAERELDRAVAMHHSHLPITLLNQSVLLLDRSQWPTARNKISDALLLIQEREQIHVGYLALRMLPGVSIGRNSRFEQNPANTLEAAYVNLAYAWAMDGNNGEAKGVLEEGISLLPSSAYLHFALARLHIFSNRVNLAEPIYLDLSKLCITNRSITTEVTREATRITRSKSRRLRKRQQ